MKIKKFINQSPIFALYQAQSHILEPFQRALSKHSVHLLQGLVLTALFFEDREVRPTELQKIFEVEPSNLSHTLRGLEKKGFLKRTMHSTDARGYLFGLTIAGKKKSIALIKEFDLIQSQIEQKLGLKRTKDLVEDIQHFVNFLKS